MNLCGVTKLVILLLALVLVGESTGQSLEEREREAVQFMKSLNNELNRMRNLRAEAEWAFQSNLTDENESKANEVAAEVAKFFKKKGKELLKYDFRNFKDENLRRQFKKLSKLGHAALSDKEFNELKIVLRKMQSNYSKVKVCSYTVRTKCNLALNPDIEDIISKSRDPDELKYYWKEWYDKAGAPVRKYFDKYVELNEKAARLNNFSSGADAWLDEYDDDTFEQQIENIFDQLRPLYEQLHGYVRWRLNKYYGNDIVSEKGPIPMHLLGNLWAQTWEDIANIVQPFPDKPLLDVSDEMIKQGYTTLKMFQMADGFFESMNMSRVPHTFWAKSIIEKPDDREMVCHASAWDFFKIDDVRIKMCTKVNMDNFFTIHHELGHIQYYLQYQHLPCVFRTGANPGFHEAVGDVLSISVSTPKHLRTIGLLKDYKPDKESRLNQLFLKALSKIVFLPFSFTLDKYRWAIFRGEIKPDEYNCAFWKLREQYSGIEPPVQRTENDFDAAAKYHISANVEYLRYLVSYIIQFQFYKTACEKAGQYVRNDPMLPLENCDIYGSAAAGNAFKAMLSLGASKPWADALEVFTGERKMTANAIMEYFEPLKIWLEEKNKKNNVYIGWEPSTKCSLDRYYNSSYVKILPKFTLVLSNYWLLAKSSISK